jgi:hypothetical protein
MMLLAFHLPTHATRSYHSVDSGEAFADAALRAPGQK